MLKRNCSKYLKEKLEYPDTKGYSARNLKYMAKFAALFPEKEIVQEVLAQLSWYHVVTLINQVKSTINRRH
ncbi:DUF1016 N-terminal domain-containing protein [uncultured Anaerovibrio sp.]|uniref:DUF1016 N-terminal domain-containing protein n=1 Tax=uncultured Anaerovibrio sp. TaxID=361586 RepID=UPI00341F7EA1